MCTVPVPAGWLPDAQPVRVLCDVPYALRSAGLAGPFVRGVDSSPSRVAAVLTDGRTDSQLESSDVPYALRPRGGGGSRGRGRGGKTFPIEDVRSRRRQNKYRTPSPSTGLVEFLRNCYCCCV